MTNEGADTPLIFMPDLGNNLLYAQKIVTALPSPMAVFGMRLDRQLVDRLEFLQIEDIAAIFAADLIRSQIVPPYRLVGHSFAGMLAFETAAQLEKRNEPRVEVYLLDAGLAAESFWKLRPRQWPGAIGLSVKFMIRRARDLFWELGQGSGRRRYLHQKYFLRIDLTAHPPAYRFVISNMYRAMTQYRPTRFSGGVQLFRAKHRGLFRRQDDDLGWRRFCEHPIRICHVDCNHLDMVKDSAVAVHVAGQLAEILYRSKPA